MKNYLDLMEKILTKGESRKDRTGTGTLALFGEQLKFDLSKGFPAVTTKRLAFKTMQKELSWMLQGHTNVKHLNDVNVHIWDANADEHGELGPVYGAQWRDWPACDYEQGVDQVAALITNLQTNPHSRRHIITAWNVSELNLMRLPPCHVMSQFYVSNDGKLSCHMYQRSCDYFLGGPFNIAQYALLTHSLARTIGHLNPGHLTISYGDVHIYNDHIEQCKLQLSRSPKKLPNIIRKNHLGLMEVGVDKLIKCVEDYRLAGYEHHPHIKADMSV